MINVKFIVLFLIFDVVTSSVKYCEICPNHTLCKYNMAGPSSLCKEYVESRITKGDANNIINKINERRNSIAAGLSGLPQAANMNKIYWCTELATFAQRWVDQCDSTRLDKEDECRDLEDASVGQAVISVPLPAPGMKLKSLIDVWFMQILDYRGSVSYYNQSRDGKTNYFTQLIWAETDRIGCGRARFYVNQRGSMVERLVCNFAPKGNVNGKPVYTIGYPATQCQQNKMRDRIFESLCRYVVEDNVKRSRTSKPAITSLLRILNLSNNTANANRGNVIKFDVNESNEERNQRIRHVFFNNSHDLLKNAPALPIRSHFNSQSQAQRLQNHKQEDGHSKVYHRHDMVDHNYGSDYREFLNYQTQKNPSDHQSNHRKFNVHTTKLNNPSSSTDLRKYNKHFQCTRKSGTRYQNWQSLPSNKCTRKYDKNSMQVASPCPESIPYIENQSSLCSCNNPTTPCATLSPRSQCNSNCKSFDVGHYSNVPNAHFRSSNDKHESKKLGDLPHYDILPSMVKRIGDDPIEMLSSTEISLRDQWFQHEAIPDDIFQRSSSKIKYDHTQVKNIIEKKRNDKQDYDFIRDSSYYRERKRRNPEDEVQFKPFWRMDEYNYDKSTLLKSMRYTTLPNRNIKKTRRINTITTLRTLTESITVPHKASPKVNQNQKHVLTEKYLSFDELMHLRKFTSTEAIETRNSNTETKVVSNIDSRRNYNVDARRADTNSTPEYTTNTPFMRKKHCTRKLTCTWTTPTVVDEHGNVINSGKRGDRGSRTPPGYVEGCTRTSTCTRDFMDRNKFATTPNESGSGDTTLEDEDYCEKRDLEVRKRNSEVIEETGKNNYYQMFKYTPSYAAHFTNTRREFDYSFTQSTSQKRIENCVCNDGSLRRKRQESSSNDHDKRYLGQYRSYGDIYYSVLQKVIQTWKDNVNLNHPNTCFCNSSFLIRSSISLLLFIFLYNVIINVLF